VDNSYSSKTVADWYGAALIANYQFTDRFSVAGRGEYFVDADGARTGWGQDLWEFSITPTFWVTPKLLARLEYRTDHSTSKFFLQRSAAIKHQDTIFGEVSYLFP
jgi:hypothetical protein